MKNMKTMKFAKLLLPILCLSLAALGCHKHPQSPTKLPGMRGDNNPDVGNSGSITNPPSADAAGGTPLPSNDELSKYNPDPEAFKADTVHFAFDSSAVKADDKSKVSDVATALKSSPNNKVQIEGHCDERGTEEYNRSLGERRALAIREQLIQDGIGGDRVFTISYGKDRPVDSGHDEAAWSQNRRGVFILLTPKAQAQ
jgi:peptidoglycan-associated lipoprotein